MNKLLIYNNYLKENIELSTNREKHIAERHPELLPEYRHLLIETVSNPEQIRRSERMGTAKLFTKWFPDLLGGKYIVAVVISEPNQSRRWIVTAYVTRKITIGDLEWHRN